MIHDTSSSRASTACHYSPSLVAEEQLHGSKDTLTLKGEKALLELLLGMVCVSHSPRSLLYYLIFITISDPLQALDQHVDGRKLITQQEAEDSDFESYLREATSRVLYQPTFMYGASEFISSEEDDDDDSVSESSSASLAKPAGTLDLGKLTEEPQPHRFVPSTSNTLFLSFIILTLDHHCVATTAVWIQTIRMIKCLLDPLGYWRGDPRNATAATGLWIMVWRAVV